MARPTSAGRASWLPPWSTRHQSRPRLLRLDQTGRTPARLTTSLLLNPGLIGSPRGERNAAGPRGWSRLSAAADRCRAGSLRCRETRRRARRWTLGRIVPGHLSDAVDGLRPGWVELLELHAAAPQLTHDVVKVLDLKSHLGEGSRGCHRRREQRELAAGVPVQQPPGRWSTGSSSSFSA